MRFRIVSHACLDVSAGGKRLIIDPWLSEPAYWSSWWLCPTPQYQPDLFDADYVYVTHWHFDHFDPRTLRRFRKTTIPIVAKFPISGLRQQLEKLGFERVVELRHGERMKLGDDFWLTSYQVSFQDDSVAVVESGGTVLVDLNDAKPLPSLWRKFRARYPRVDFMLRSHSPAWSYPTRYTFEDLADRLPVDSETYMEAFVSAAQQLRPRYAVPFASGICHLHREVRDENRFLVTAAEMRGYFESNASRVPNTKLVVMPAGSSWSSQRGFELTDNAVDDVVAYAEARAATQAERLEETYRSEDAKQVAYADFSAYFENFFRATRWLRPLACGARWVFAIERPAEFWTLDFGKASIEAGTQMPDRYDSVIKVSPAVLSGGLRNGVFTNIDIAKRWRVHVKRDRAMRHFVIANLLLLYEAEYLSPRRLLSWRFLSGYARRLPEIVDYALMALRTVSKGKESIVTAVTSIAEG